MRKLYEVKVGVKLAGVFMVKAENETQANLVIGRRINRGEIAYEDFKIDGEWKTECTEKGKAK